MCLAPACVKTDHRLCCAMPAVEFVRTQTQCADSWGYGNSNDETLVKLKNYLLQQQVTVVKIELQASGEQNACAACTCSRGFVFHVWASSQHINALTGLGFTIK